MKTKQISYFLFTLYLLTIGSCNKDDINVTTGIIGRVEYGQGDCMPGTDPKLREYTGYSGKVFFIVKEVFEPILLQKQINLVNADTNAIGGYSQDMIKKAMKDSNLECLLEDVLPYITEKITTNAQNEEIQTLSITLYKPKNEPTEQSNG